MSLSFGELASGLDDITALMDPDAKPENHDRAVRNVGFAVALAVILNGAGGAKGIWARLSSLLSKINPLRAKGALPQVARAIEQGLVKEGGKLSQVLSGIESGFGASGPKSAMEALGIVKNATSAVGLEPGVATLGKGGEILLQNVGGISTTLGTNGSILVQRGSDVLLHLVP